MSANDKDSPNANPSNTNGALSPSVKKPFSPSNPLYDQTMYLHRHGANFEAFRNFFLHHASQSSPTTTTPSHSPKGNPVYIKTKILQHLCYTLLEVTSSSYLIQEEERYLFNFNNIILSAWQTVLAAAASYSQWEIAVHYYFFRRRQTQQKRRDVRRNKETAVEEESSEEEDDDEEGNPSQGKEQGDKERFLLLTLYLRYKEQERLVYKGVEQARQVLIILLFQRFFRTPSLCIRVEKHNMMDMLLEKEVQIPLSRFQEKKEKKLHPRRTGSSKEGSTESENTSTPLARQKALEWINEILSSIERRCFSSSPSSSKEPTGSTRPARRSPPPPSNRVRLTRKVTMSSARKKRERNPPTGPLPPLKGVSLPPLLPTRPASALRRSPGRRRDDSDDDDRFEDLSSSTLSEDGMEKKTALQSERTSQGSRPLLRPVYARHRKGRRPQTTFAKHANRNTLLNLEGITPVPLLYFISAVNHNGYTPTTVGGGGREEEEEQRGSKRCPWGSLFPLKTNTECAFSLLTRCIFYIDSFFNDDTDNDDDDDNISVDQGGEGNRKEPGRNKGQSDEGYYQIIIAVRTIQNNSCFHTENCFANRNFFFVKCNPPSESPPSRRSRRGSIGRRAPLELTRSPSTVDLPQFFPSREDGHALTTGDAEKEEKDDDNTLPAPHPNLLESFTESMRLHSQSVRDLLSLGNTNNNTNTGSNVISSNISEADRTDSPDRQNTPPFTSPNHFYYSNSNTRPPRGTVEAEEEEDEEEDLKYIIIQSDVCSVLGNPLHPILLLGDGSGHCTPHPPPRCATPSPPSSPPRERRRRQDGRNREEEALITKTESTTAKPVTVAAAPRSFNHTRNNSHQQFRSEVHAEVATDTTAVTPSPGDIAYCNELYSRLQFWCLRGQKRDYLLDSYDGGEEEEEEKENQKDNTDYCTTGSHGEKVVEEEEEEKESEEKHSLDDVDRTPQEVLLPLQLLSLHVGAIRLDKTNPKPHAEGNSVENILEFNLKGQHLLFQALQDTHYVCIASLRETRAHGFHSLSAKGPGETVTAVEEDTPFHNVLHRLPKEEEEEDMAEYRRISTFSDEDSEGEMEGASLFHRPVNNKKAKRHRQHHPSDTAASRYFHSSSMYRFDTYKNIRTGGTVSWDPLLVLEEEEENRETTSSDGGNHPTIKPKRLSSSESHQLRVETIKTIFKIKRSKKLECFLINREKDCPVARITLQCVSTEEQDTSLHPSFPNVVLGHAADHDDASLQEILSPSHYTVLHYSPYISPLWNSLRTQNIAFIDLDRTLIDNNILLRNKTHPTGEEGEEEEENGGDDVYRNCLPDYLQHPQSRRGSLCSSPVYYEDSQLAQYPSCLPVESGALSSVYPVPQLAVPPLQERLFLRPFVRYNLHHSIVQWNIPLVLVTLSSYVRAKAALEQLVDPGHHLFFDTDVLPVDPYEVDKVEAAEEGEREGEEGRGGPVYPLHLISKELMEAIHRECERTHNNHHHQDIKEEGKVEEEVGKTGEGETTVGNNISTRKSVVLKNSTELIQFYVSQLLRYSRFSEDSVGDIFPFLRSIAVLDDSPQAWEKEDWNSTIAIAAYTLRRRDPDHYFYQNLLGGGTTISSALHRRLSKNNSFISVSLISSLFSRNSLRCPVVYTERNTPTGDEGEKDLIHSFFKQWHCICSCSQHPSLLPVVNGMGGLEEESSSSLSSYRLSEDENKYMSSFLKRYYGVKENTKHIPFYPPTPSGRVGGMEGSGSGSEVPPTPMSFSSLSRLLPGGLRALKRLHANYSNREQAEVEDEEEEEEEVITGGEAEEMDNTSFSIPVTGEGGVDLASSVSQPFSGWRGEAEEVVPLSLPASTAEVASAGGEGGAAVGNCSEDARRVDEVEDVVPL